MKSFQIDNEKFEQIKMYEEVIRNVENTTGRRLENLILLSFWYFEKDEKDSREKEDLRYQVKFSIKYLIEKKFSSKDKKSYIQAVYNEFYDQSVDYEEKHIDLSKEDVEILKEEYKYI